jgi:hypothetical protein
VLANWTETTYSDSTDTVPTSLRQRRHFKRLVGVTPGQFRMSARFA